MILKLPVKIRDKFKSGLVIAKGLNHCLHLFTPGEWLALQNAVKKLPLSYSDLANLLGIMSNGTIKVSIRNDKVNIPSHLLKCAKIMNENNAFFISRGNRVDIRSKGNFRNV